MFEIRFMETMDDDSVQSCWAKMPPELLTDVLKRIEESESNWPSRKYVVYCAGVCRSWRKIMMEIVKSPQLSGKLTFPISLKQPGLVDSLTQCLIERDRKNQIYYLYLHKNKDPYYEGKFLLVAKKVKRATCTDYIIFLNIRDVLVGSSTCIGKLRSNLFGTKYKVYDIQPPIAATKWLSSMLGSIKRVWPKVPAGNYPVSSISYEVNALGIRGPRQMRCETNTMHPNSFFKFKDDSQLLPTGQKDGKLVLKNKTPRWHPRRKKWCLNFNDRVRFASVKNFQLVACLDNEAAGVKERENIFLQFGKVDRDYYTMDYQYPISAFQAFAICLSSFHTKVAYQ